MVFYRDQWDPNLCKTLSINTSPDGVSAYVTCQCSVSGPIALGLVNSGEPVITIQDVYAFSKILKFK